MVDARSDQYSLACVLYEMLAGKPPFEGPSAQTIIAKSLTAPRPHVGQHQGRGLFRARPGGGQGALPGARRPLPRHGLAPLGARPRREACPDVGARRWIVGGGAIAVLAGVAMGVWFADRPRAGG